MNRILRYFSRGWHRLSRNWQVLGERPVPVEELNCTLEQASIPSASFYSLLAIATAIATFGLLSNNAATIIGAMIIAPLMNPIVTLSYGAIAIERQLLERGTLTLVTGIILVTSIAFLGTHLVGTKVVNAQILARVEPNLLDLGVAIASGATAGLAYARRSIATALPGVAIAVALVPPLCVVGIGLAIGEGAIIDIGLYFSRQGQQLNLSSGAFLLFLANLAGTVFCTGLVFLIQGYGNWQKAVAGMSLTIAIIVLVSLPLSNQLQDFLLRNKVLESLVKFERTYSHLQEWITPIQYTDIYIANRENEIYIQVDVIAPIGLVSQDDIDLAQEFMSEELEKPVNLQINLLPFYILKKEPPSTN